MPGTWPGSRGVTPSEAMQTQHHDRSSAQRLRGKAWGRSLSHVPDCTRPLVLLSPLASSGSEGDGERGAAEERPTPSGSTCQTAAER